MEFVSKRKNVRVPCERRLEGGVEKGWPRNCESVGGKGVIDWRKLLTD